MNMHITTFEHSVQAIERQSTRIRELYHELQECLPECAPTDTINNFSKTAEQMRTVA